MSITIQLAFDFDSAGDADRAASHSNVEQLGMAPARTAALTDPSRVGAPPPLDYTLKVSATARRVYLRVVPGRGLVVTIPRRYPRRDIKRLVEEQRGWIEEALADLHAQTPAAYRQWPPDTLHLAACETTVTISCIPAAAADAAEGRWMSATELQLAVSPDNKVAVAECVAAALKTRARTVLAPRLAELAQQHGFTYRRVAIRGQRTLWGSYSSSGTLSLNYKLLFLPADVVDYVLLHELTHTRHLDHSPAFWQLLETVQPGARTLDATLGDMGLLVPPWLELAR